jgi:hypothetical protein
MVDVSHIELEVETAASALALSTALCPVVALLVCSVFQGRAKEIVFDDGQEPIRRRIDCRGARRVWPTRNVQIKATAGGSLHGFMRGILT